MKRKIYYIFLASILAVLSLLVVWNFDDVRRAYAVRGDIDFYGLVLDENGDPIPNLPVMIGIVEPNFFMHLLGYRKDSRRFVYTNTDASGKFFLENEQGIFISVTVENSAGHIFNPQDLDRINKFPDQRKEKYYEKYVANGGITYSYEFNGFAVKEGTAYTPNQNNPEIFVGYDRDSRSMIMLTK